MAENKEPTKPVVTQNESKRIGSEMYAESAKAVREVGARVVLSVGAAILIWLAGRLIFVPLAEGITNELLGYPVTAIVGAVVAVALAIIIFTVFIDIRRLKPS